MLHYLSDRPGYDGNAEFHEPWRCRGAPVDHAGHRRYPADLTPAGRNSVCDSWACRRLAVQQRSEDLGRKATPQRCHTFGTGRRCQFSKWSRHGFCSNLSGIGNCRLPISACASPESICFHHRWCAYLRDRRQPNLPRRTLSDRCPLRVVRGLPLDVRLLARSQTFPSPVGMSAKHTFR